MLSPTPRDASDRAFDRLLRVLHAPDGFVKIHGAGNDFIVLDGRKHRFHPDALRVMAMCDRHTGIGGDQVLVLEVPTTPAADVRLRIYNIDGMEAETCFNATRCVAWLMMKEACAERIRVETIGGIIDGQFADDGLVTLHVPAARLDWRSIPLAEERDTLALGLTAGPLTAQAAVSMGNPHLVCLVPSLDAIEVPKWADQLQKHPLLPEGANVGVGEIIDDTHMRLVVWERPGILTKACGSGACAALVAARRLGLTRSNRMEVAMPGGRLIAEEAPDGTLLLTGAVEVAFLGLLP